ncbi:type VI secretion system tube protein TssD [Olleya sp. HaHaR_3_96]|uniref:type VI secretion system tube protein TssD n=1 Tax=Olleya sp. HaHaR_3_96 TaxID=2745560 RepID=UPI001C4EBE12|nr:type VI secretion system tube protein TssD [Olleya sp. HaHaR_3_96]QXP58479.1 hypothetical protein H0I26_11160 [Olleya sp. HaHaR_3_96]
MSISAKLYIEDKVFNVLKFGFKFNQKSSASGYPSATTTGGQFDIVIESTKDPLFFEWMTSGDMLSKAKIEVSQSFVFGKTRKIELLDVYCLQFQEKFDGINSQPMQSFLRLSPAIMLQDGAKIFEWYWKVTDLEANAEDTVIDNAEPKLLSYHIEDLENNIIEEKTIKENQEIYLVINSENTQDEISDIDLDNSAIDFEYNGEWMEDDIIRDIVLNDNFTKVKLKAVKQQQQQN